MRRRKRKSRSLRTVALSSALLLGAGAGGYAFMSLESGNPSPLASAEGRNIVYPAPYSDTRITASAVISDPRFKDSVTIGNENAAANIFSIVRRWSYGSLPPPPPDTTPEKGTWLWTPVLEITPEYRDSIIAGAKRGGITEIYLSIDSYLDIHALPDGEAKEEKRRAFDRKLEDFIAHARKAGIAVDAEAGWRNWAEPGHEYKAFATLQYAIEYNRTHGEKLRGFQFDVEPYLLEEYEQDKEGVLRRFVALIDASVVWLYGSDLKLSLAIPDFYDGSYGDTRKYFYGLRRGHTIDHLLGVLERRPGSSLVIMAYRNFTEGPDGALAIVRQEIEAAEGYRTEIIVAQETGDFPPSYITFHNTSRERYERQVAEIARAFAGKESFGGVSTHYINALMALR